MPRGETAGAAFLLEGVTVQARLAKSAGLAFLRRLPLFVVSVHRVSVRPFSSTSLP